jgi:hypothetical protein
MMDAISVEERTRLYMRTSSIFPLENVDGTPQLRPAPILVPPTPELLLEGYIIGPVIEVSLAARAPLT